MAKASPTNNDIMKFLSIIQDENTERHNETAKRLAAIELQVKYTNGQVRDLQQWRSNKEAAERAVSEYRNENQPTIKVNNNFQWDWKMVLAILLTLATIFAGIVGVQVK